MCKNTIYKHNLLFVTIQLKKYPDNEHLRVDVLCQGSETTISTNFQKEINK